MNKKPARKSGAKKKPGAQKKFTVQEFASQGGKAVWAKLTPKQRSAKARKIIQGRWKKKRQQEAAAKQKAADRKAARATHTKNGKRK